MNKFNDFYEAWQWLNTTIAFYNPEYWLDNDIDEMLVMGAGQRFRSALDIEVVKVNPNTNRISNDEHRNTKTQVWLECGTFFYEEDYEFWASYHNTDYDNGGDTFEEAIVNLANAVYKDFDTPEKISAHKAILEGYIKKAKRRTQ